MAVKLAIAGASGRMGRMLIEAALKDESVQVVAALDREDSPLLGRDAGELVGATLGVTISTNVDAAFQLADCMIDFTRPEATLQHIDAAIRAGKSIVIGTTGFDAAGKAAIAAAAGKISLVFAPNMAVGVNAVFKLLDVAARILAEGYDIEVIETHHRHKVDAPSGTALRMGEVVARAAGIDLDVNAIFGREGVTGERPAKQIGFSTIRGGDVVGDYTVLFAGFGERIEITYKSSSRIPYTLKTLRAARFLAGRKAGAYDMQDVLGLK